MTSNPTVWLDEVTYLNPSLLSGGPVDDDDDLDHLTCAVCDPDMTTSLCGRDITDLEFSDDLDDFDALCVVCRDLEACPRCGDKFDSWTAGGGA